jgi:hypothetical protein
MSYQKYHSKKTVVNGIMFDSKLEAERYKQLLLLEKAGAISDLKLQPEIQIAEGWTDPQTGEKHRSRFYVGDFKYLDCENHCWVIEDAKGIETDVFRLKWEYVQSEHPEYLFRKMTRSDV